MAISDALSGSNANHPATYEILKIVACKDAKIETKRNLSNKIKKIEREAVQKSIALMVKELYDRDKEALEKDIAKLSLLVTEEVHTNPLERLRLLHIYWWIISTYFEGNIGLLVDMCKKEERP